MEKIILSKNIRNVCSKKFLLATGGHRAPPLKAIEKRDKLMQKWCFGGGGTER